MFGAYCRCGRDQSLTRREKESVDFDQLEWRSGLYRLDCRARKLRSAEYCLKTASIEERDWYRWRLDRLRFSHGLALLRNDDYFDSASMK